MTDPIADMLSRIKNAHAAGKTEVVVPYSKLKEAIARILEKEGYVVAVERHEKAVQDDLILKLKYVGKVPAITQLKRISKPGRRIYASANKIPRSLGGYGLTIISTSKGVITGQEAKKVNAGGELLCQVW